VGGEQDWNPFHREAGDPGFDDEFDKLHLDNQSRDTLINSEDVFSSAPFSLPGTLISHPIESIHCWRRGGWVN